MTKCSLSLFLKFLCRALIPLLVFVDATHAQVSKSEYLLVVETGQNLTASQRQALLQGLAGANVTPLFSSQEKSILTSMGLGYMSQNLVVKDLPRGTTVEQLQDRLKALGLPFRLERDLNPVAISSRTEEVSSVYQGRQWHLKNTGEGQRIQLNPVMSDFIPGRVGEDLGLHFSADLPGLKGLTPLGRKVRVAVLDTGMDTLHPDLSPVLARNESECAAWEKFQGLMAGNDAQEMAELEACDRKFEGDANTAERATCRAKVRASAKLVREQLPKTWYDIQNPEVDRDGNGYPMDCTGWNVADLKQNPSGILGSPEMKDSINHASHISGIYATAGLGVTGVGNYGLRESPIEILPVAILGERPLGPLVPQQTNRPSRPGEPSSEPGAGVPLVPGAPPSPREGDLRNLRTSLASQLAARGIIYAIRSNADIINLSVGWPAVGDSRILQQLVAEAVARGILVFAAAGNDATKALVRPCGYPQVLCVAASGPDGAIAPFSNYGSTVDFAAPGVSILSTVPLLQRSLALRGVRGYDTLSGSSQATPGAGAVAARLLALGVPRGEVVARMLLGARPLQPSLGVERVSSQGPVPVEVGSQTLAFESSKNVLSGNVSLSGALRVKPQPLLVTETKIPTQVLWDGSSSILEFKFNLLNRWQEVPSSEVRIQGKLLNSGNSRYLPSLLSVTLDPVATGSDAWTNGQIRSATARLAIADKSPESTRLPSDLEIELEISFANSGTQSIRPVARASVQRVIAKSTTGPDIDVLPLVLPPGEERMTTLTSFDEVLDGRPSRDFLYRINRADNKAAELHLISQNNGVGAYQSQGSIVLTPDWIPDLTLDRAVLNYRYRLPGPTSNPMDSIYILGVYFDRDNARPPQPSPAVFVVLNSRFQEVDRIPVDSVLAQIPLRVIRWTKFGESLRPVWVGEGRNPYNKTTGWDVWNKRDSVAGVNSDTRGIALYWMDQNKTLQAISEFQGYKVIEVLQPSQQQIMSGVVPVLLAKDTGTPAQPSYVYSYATAEFVAGRLGSLKALQGNVYHNLLDTRMEPVYAVDSNSAEPYAGMMWFSRGSSQTQRLTMIDRYTLLPFTTLLASFRRLIDGVLWVRAAFAGPGQRSAFAMTNSEIQFHDFQRNSVHFRSLERFTFLGTQATTNLQFQTVVVDEEFGTKVPALFTPEGVGTERTMQVTVPDYEGKFSPTNANTGRVTHLNLPARFRLRPEVGCAVIRDPFLNGPGGHTYFDVNCGDRVVRIRLSY